jgi:hypothetical protein
VARARLSEHGSANGSESRIPPEYLESLFGSEAHGALKTLNVEPDQRRGDEPSASTDILIMCWWKEALGPFAGGPADIVRR